MYLPLPAGQYSWLNFEALVNRGDAPLGMHPWAGWRTSRFSERPHFPEMSHASEAAAGGPSFLQPSHRPTRWLNEPFGP